TKANTWLQLVSKLMALSQYTTCFQYIVSAWTELTSGVRNIAEAALLSNNPRIKSRFHTFALCMNRPFTFKYDNTGCKNRGLGKSSPSRV
ncbi:hypothetical protein A2U01_0011952, partial [Trifolium medium]|nr:hypothetical protein [Trifolium medium]